MGSYFRFFLLYCFYFVSFLIDATVLVREYEKTKDLSSVLDICAENWRELGFDDWTCPELQVQLYEHFPGSGTEVRIIECEGKVVGFAIHVAPYVTPLLREYTLQRKYADLLYYLSDEAGLAELSFIAIAKEFQGKGYGQLLFEDIRKDAKKLGMTFIISHVKKSNHHGLEWHKKQGFVSLNTFHGGTILFDLMNIYADAHDYHLLFHHLHCDTNDGIQIDESMLPLMGSLPVETFAQVMNEEAVQNKKSIEKSAKTLKYLVKLAESHDFFDAALNTRIISFYLQSKSKQKTIRFIELLLSCKLTHEKVEKTGRLLSFVDLNRVAIANS